MFGMIKDFKVNDNIIKVRFENIEAKINIISPNIINFFVPNFRDEQTSVAIENLKIQHCTYEIDRYIDNITIKNVKNLLDCYKHPIPKNQQDVCHLFNKLNPYLWKQWLNYKDI